MLLHSRMLTGKESKERHSTYKVLYSGHGRRIIRVSFAAWSPTIGDDFLPTCKRASWQCDFSHGPHGAIGNNYTSLVKA